MLSKFDKTCEARSSENSQQQSLNFYQCEEIKKLN